ncbi:D-alanyl-D-alanine carboxypeptidase [Saccharopolyspora antimicrobica]|uniref:D-alanyl-D-alanine carboxypeptidase n=1 Tax=Saccharopolyspora antimicrobica TaxID=455193 RepID=A0A1I4TE03_9PSEU|nr:serine hydrolase domain-containing protein [Saccharopolyspora antimicrobica]RKT85755.1 D-alanyl-D-alanine carboxypeptidase [Saccharopolyspora antimicrobica]SFM74912.1 D-alanyl-D-alanine carboxypeptidase [Saccharopolyspora antimicrobica]
MTKPVPRTAPAPSSTAENDHTAVERLLDRAVTEGGVPGILAEARTGDLRWFGSAGVADTEAGGARLPEHRFRIGSITKTFVAVVVLQLVSERKLGLDDTVAQLLPGAVRGNGHDASRITLRQLLNNTSGIFDYTRDQEALSQRESYSPEQLVQIAMSGPADFEPGAGWAYSNTNYVLAGMIVERVTGRRLADEITQRIAQPLGLDGTYLPRGNDQSIRGPHSRHYTKLHQPDPGAEIYDVTEMDTTPFWAAGGMISTAGNLNEFFAALLGGRLLPAEQQREMFTTVVAENWIPRTTYGLGVSSVTLPGGTTAWGMGGAIFGSWSYAYGTRDGRRFITTNVNGDWTTGGWDDPIGIFTDVLRAELCANDQR